MAPSRNEREVRQHFGRRYGLAASDATAAVERLVIGSDFGANGYTTVSQADVLADRLALRPGDRLLDVGAGRGWPGLYLATKTGCDIVLTDLPVEGLRTARARARDERLSHRAAMVLSSAPGLPFRSGAFDAIVHTDVLC
jgi:2-polyprenyl-3-methyl-5-hydroxy-6-metoxy-1,4-benzoquinol methylase